jgi:RimJ/RimL family protein N-acetyltransferase
MKSSTAYLTAGMVELASRMEGSLVVLEPLERRHAEGLWRAAQAPEIWQWLARLDAARERFDEWLELSLTSAAEGKEGTFAILDRGSGTAIGSSRYMAVRPVDRVLEVGWTWFNPSVWRTGANVETKLLLLGHAFERLECQRVELKTDARNERSRAAIAALPAQFEGILRKHMIVPDVGVRDSAMFSIVDDEWPDVRANLERRLAQSGSPSK